MGRPLSYRDNSEERARAGAVTLARMEDAAVDESRYQDAQARMDRQEARAESRDQRIDESADLENEVRRYQFEKTKTMDANEARFRADLDKQATEANQALRDISLDADDAETKIANWEAKYFRVLDPEVGDKRLQKQHEVNTRMLERRRVTREKADSLNKAGELAKEAGLKLKSVSGDTATYGRDEPADDGKAVLSSLERERSMQAKFLDRAKRIRSRATDEDIIRDTDADILEAQKALGDIESQIRTRREGGKVPPTTPPTATAAPGGDGGEDSRKSAALRWAEANPSDPRSAAVKQKLGL
jgi:hypothetical protein